jgi:hypothetical protein
VYESAKVGSPPIDIALAAGVVRMVSALLVAVLSASIAQQPAGTVAGVVRSEGSEAPLRFATIEVVLPGRAPTSAVSDSLGAYVLRNVPAGRRVVRVTHFDHAPHEAEIIVPTSGQVTLDFYLELRPLRLDPVTARTRGGGATVARDTAAVNEQGVLSATGVHVLEATPGVAELGLAEAAREVPGQDPPDPSDVLFVRGGAADLKLVLLDGAPVYAPFHLGGLINALDVELLSSARMYLGGAPARYDGGLSYVMDLETRRGNATSSHAIAGLDLLSARALMEGPVGPRISYLLGGRALHGLGGEPFVGDPFPYTYGDGLARVDFDLGRVGQLTTTGFWNRESVMLDTLRSFEPAAWGNSAGSARLHTRLGRVGVRSTAAIGTFTTQLPIGGFRPMVTDATAERIRFALETDYIANAFRLQVGASHDHARYTYRAWPKGSPPDSALLHSVGEGDVTGAYVDATWQLGDRVLLRGGLRGDVFSIAPALRLAPRLAGTVLLTDRSALTLAAGRYRQHVRAASQSLVFIGAAIPDTVSSPPLAVAGATHFVVALDQDLGEGLVLGAEGFFKKYEGLPGSGGNSAEASGIDIWFRRAAGAVNGWLGYSLSWIWTLDPSGVRPQQIGAGRHLMTGGLTGPLPGNGFFDVRLGYGAGLPFTAIPEPEAGTPVFSRAPSPSEASVRTAAEVPGVPAEPDRPYIRVDAQVARTWRSDWQGFDFQVTPYVKIVNALNRRDALFYHFDRGVDSPEPRAIAALPVLPIVGVEWRF